MQEEHDTQTRILRALRFRPKGMTITDVAKQIGATRSSVSKHLEILQIAGRVEVRNVGNAKVYSLAQRVPISAFLCFTKNPILILDDDGRIVQINDQCLKSLPPPEGRLDRTDPCRGGAPGRLQSRGDRRHRGARARAGRHRPSLPE